MKMFFSVLSAILGLVLSSPQRIFSGGKGNAWRRWQEAKQESLQAFEYAGDNDLAETDEVHLFQYEPALKLTDVLEHKPILSLSGEERALLSARLRNTHR